MDDLVSIIVRTHSKDRITKLSEAIKSIEMNTYRPIEVIIVIQSEDEHFIEEVNKLAQNEMTIDFIVLTVVNRTSRDERAKNLNIGVKLSKGRYLGFLDDDDVFYQDHLSKIVSALSKSQQSWAYCGYNVVLYDSYSFQIIKSEEMLIPFTIEQFLNNNFIPIHSFLFDRQKTSDALLFPEDLSCFEDYHFLLRLTRHSSPLFIPHITSEYKLWSDGSNSNFLAEQILGKKFSEKADKWIECVDKIETLKQMLYPFYKNGSFKHRSKMFLYSKFPFVFYVKSFLNNILTTVRRALP